MVPKYCIHGDFHEYLPSPIQIFQQTPRSQGDEMTTSGWSTSYGIDLLHLLLYKFIVIWSLSSHIEFQHGFCGIVRIHTKLHNTSRCSDYECELLPQFQFYCIYRRGSDNKRRCLWGALKSLQFVTFFVTPCPWGFEWTQLATNSLTISPVHMTPKRTTSWRILLHKVSAEYGIHNLWRGAQANMSETADSRGFTPSW